MKRKFLAVVLILCAALFCLDAGAVSTLPYDIAELEMDLLLPEDMLATTRQIDSDNELLTLFGIDEQELLETMEYNESYLIAYPPDFTSYITVTAWETDLAEEMINLAGAGTEKTEELLDQVKENAKSSGFDYLGRTDFGVGPVRFIRLDFIGDEVMAEHYVTVVNGREINLTQYVYQDEIFPEQTQRMEDIIFSVTFRNIEPSPVVEQQGGTDAFTASLVIGILFPVIFVLIILAVVFAAKKKQGRGGLPPAAAPKREESRELSHCERNKNMSRAEHQLQHQLEQAEDFYKSGFLTREEYLDQIKRLRGQ